MTDHSRARFAIEDFGDDFAPLGVMRGMIFGHHGLKTERRKVFCFERGDSMVFKLTGSAYDDACELPGATLFAPGGERPMTGWVVVPEARAERWPQLAQVAFDCVSALA
jgi:hypothetical protein